MHCGRRQDVGIFIGRASRGLLYRWPAMGFKFQPRSRQHVTESSEILLSKSKTSGVTQ